MRCHRAQRLLSAYLDDEIGPHRRAWLESHLAGCASCAAELSKLRAQWEALAEADQAPALPRDLWPRVLAALDTSGRRSWLRRHRTRLGQAACVAACVALGFAGGALLTWRRPAVGSADNIPPGEHMLVAEAFDNAAFGLGENKEGLLPCVPR